MENKKEYEIPAKGSLGLLALGDIGIEMWRKKRKEVRKQIKDQKKDKEDGEKE